MPSPFYTHGPRGLIRALLGTSNGNDIDAGFLAMATDIETKMVNYSSGLAAAMGAAGVEGRVYRQTDTGLTYFDNGSAWLLAMFAGAWVPLASVHGGVSAPRYPLAARQVGDMLHLTGEASLSVSMSSGTTLAALPAGITHPSQIQQFTVDGQGLSLTTGGQINLNGSASSGAQFDLGNSPVLRAD